MYIAQLSCVCQNKYRFTVFDKGYRHVSPRVRQISENTVHTEKKESYSRLYAINKLDVPSKQSKTSRIGLMACLQLLYLATFALKW